MTHILAIDQGTTSSRAIVFDGSMHPIAVGQQEFAQHFPASGWVEHDPEDIWTSTLETCKTALGGAGDPEIAALGITNQRETVVVWDKTTGRPVHNAIVWQDRRTATTCAALKRDGAEPDITAKTGLLLDPYFSATKIAWILENVSGARARAEQGDLLVGTIDSFLIWRLTGGRVHATDATNASRTMLYNIVDGCWDDALLKMFGVPRPMMPEVKDCAADFGTTDPKVFGKSVNICGVAGDQQAAMIGQACFDPGMMKATYGTGCFALMNTGPKAVASKNRLLTTIGYQLDGQTTYALEGSIFVAGAVVQWLRDGLGVIKAAGETDALARSADPNQQIYLVPAFTGLGAPHWDAEARGAIFGLTRNSGPAELAKAALESVAYQTRDLMEAMQRDWGGAGNTVLRVDGGMVASALTMQTLADQLAAPVDVPKVSETTALGAAYLAGLAAGDLPGPENFAKSWALRKRYEPQMDEDTRKAAYSGWKDAVQRVVKGAGV